MLRSAGKRIPAARCTPNPALRNGAPSTNGEKFRSLSLKLPNALTRWLLLWMAGSCVAAGGAAALSAEECREWRDDIAVLRTELPEKEKSFTPERLAAFHASLDSLEVALPSLNEPQAIVRVLQSVALVRNAHTSAVIARYGLDMPLLPIRVWWFEEALYVVKSRPEPDLTGRRIVRIGAHQPDEILAAVTSLFYGNESWQKYNSLQLTITPAILYGLGLIDSPDRVELTVVDAANGEQTFELSPDAAPLAEREESWWALSPAKTPEDTGWVQALDPLRDRLPLYLKEPNTVFWYEVLPDHQTIYIQYNNSGLPRGMNRSAVRAEIESHVEGGAKHIVFDLRMNTGGDYTIMRSLFEGLMENDAFQHPKGIYAITSRATFSAGLFHAANIKTHGGIIAGEIAGDNLDFWAEGSRVLLPNSQITVYAQRGFHAYSKRAYPELDRYVIVDLDLDTMEPDLPVTMTWEDYIAGGDPVLEAVLAQLGN